MQKKHLIVNIARHYGSGGREIGEKLAEKLGIHFYDKALIGLAAEESGLDPELFKHQNEEVKHGLCYLLSYISRIGAEDLPMSDRLFVATSKTIRDIAARESCVIVGRCADYVLEDKHDEHLIIDCFIRISDDEQAITRIMHRNNIGREEALEKKQRVSKGRRSYYERYTGRRYNDIEHYDLCINTAHCSIENAVDLLYRYIEQALMHEGLRLEDLR